ncbi:MAG: hypothetical protein JWM11_7074 [Planctomycetaceae bacterium]|nr:hypothetical protein [Planctomycetaceae bacterium]
MSGSFKLGSFKKVCLAGLMTILLSVSVCLGQNRPESSFSEKGVPAAANANRSDAGKFGLWGLVGLFGLMGLMRLDRYNPHDTRAAA